MPSDTAIPLPAGQALRKLGRDLALARRKRGISTADMAGRIFVSRDTLWRLERGDPTVALGTLATASFILQLHDRHLRLRFGQDPAHGNDYAGDLDPLSAQLGRELARRVADLIGEPGGRLHERVVAELEPQHFLFPEGAVF